MAIIVGVAIVIVVAGILTRNMPMERMISDNFDEEPSSDPNTPIQESQSNFATNQATKDICDSSYPDICIPPYPPDLDCGEIEFTNFRVYQPDPHGFDGDNDGIGCES